jgi:hypothetical protein
LHRLGQPNAFLAVRLHEVDASVRFVCADARTAELHLTSIIWINDAVWSPVTRSAVYAKITAEV